MLPVQNLFWLGLGSSQSAEHCRLMRSEALSSAVGTVVGLGPVFRVDYIITMGANWQFQSLRANGIVNGKEMNLYLEKDANKHWWRQERRIDSLSGCTTIDLSISPFTNTLAFQTLELLPGEHNTIQVAYVDILEGKIYAASQNYRRVSSDQYHLSTAPDIEVNITADKDGLVTDYPGYFRRKI